MPTRIDHFETLYQLGSGFSAVTKLAVDQEGNQVALKIFDLENNKISDNSLALLKTEYEATKDFCHENIVRYMTFNDSTYEIKENGHKKKVAYLAMEAVKGGELFDYIANSGAFSDKFSRHYFKQMLKAIHYIHSKGNAHRDLKPENILLDSEYNVKIIDFGFTCNITGRQGSGYNQTGVGTPGYMGPEILRKDAYYAQGVDIFALGVILFIMYAGHPPFQIAKEDDMFYKLLASGRADLFWKAHSNKKPADFFSDEFKDLITTMLQVQPFMRLSLADVVSHPWMQGEYPTAAEVQTEFARRHQVNKDRAHQEEEKKAQMEAKIRERNANNRGRQVDGTTYLAAEDVETPNLPTDIKQLTL
jgi:serine/threonine protein kinase